ncbi:Ataxin-7-like protein 3 [Tyrophagus putrescentiae]|nr:Ataxin-7-like protein 3 [Tyrophagus putrescentiae]
MFTDNLPLTIDQTSSLSDDNDFSISNDSSSPFSNTTAPSSSNSTEPEISNLTESLDDLDFVNEDLTIANRLETSQQSKPNRTNKKRDISNVDILGNSLASIRKIECVCPSCKRSLAASRLAPHLEKCMGMGRNASRVASKRIALFTKTLNGD